MAYSIALNKALKFVTGLAAVHRMSLSGRRLALLIIIRTKDLIISEYDLMHLLSCLSSYAKKQHFKFLECLKNIQIVVVDRL